MYVNKPIAIHLIGDKDFLETHMILAAGSLTEAYGHIEHSELPLQVLFSMIGELHEEIRRLKEQNQNVRLVSITKVEGTKNE